MLANIVISHFNNPFDVIPKTINYIEDPENCFFTIIDGGSTRQNIFAIIKELSKTDYRWILLKRKDWGMDIGTYYDWMRCSVENDFIDDVDIVVASCHNHSGDEPFDTKLTWFFQEHMADHMINITAIRGWQRSFNDRINVQKCYDYLLEHPKDQIGTDGCTHDPRYGYTIWTPGYIGDSCGRDIAKENQGIVDHDYWNNKLGLDPNSTHSAHGWICMLNDRIKEVFVDFKISEAETKRKGIPYELERIISLQFNESKGGVHHCYWDLFYNEEKCKSWFTKEFIQRVYNERIPIPPSDKFNELIREMYGWDPVQIKANWDEESILKEMRRKFG